MTILIITTVAVVCIAWLGLRACIDRPQAFGSLPLSALPKDCMNSELPDKPDTRLHDVFRSALTFRHIKWVEAIPDGDIVRIVGHTTRIGRDTNYNWQMGKP